MTKSWETTLAGLGAILVVIGGAIVAITDGDPSTVPDWNIVINTIAIVLLGGGMMRARDNNKKSESVGAE